MAISIIKYLWAMKTYLFYKPFFIKSIGKRCYIGRPILLSKTKHNLSIGARVRIYPSCRIETNGVGVISIGNNVSIGNGLHLYSSENVVIGNDVMISSNVFISDTDHSFERVDRPFESQETVSKKTVIGDGSFLGHNVTVLPGTTIGCHCVVGANAVVKGNLPDYTMWAGVPARKIKAFSLTKQKWVLETAHQKEK
jgi:acetyltransferase-like isoleucine patch superfamily enzyme